MKGASTEIILFIGVLIAVGLALLQLKAVFYGQTRISEQELISAFLNDVENILDSASSATGDATFSYTPPIKKYTLEIIGNKIKVSDKLSGKSASIVKTAHNIEPTFFENSETIYIVKLDDMIYIKSKSSMTTTTTTSSTTTSSSTSSTTTIIPKEAKFILIFMQLNDFVPDFQSIAEQSTDFWIQQTPLSICPESVDIVVVDDRVCNVPDQDGICSFDGQTLENTMIAISNCIDFWKDDPYYPQIDSYYTRIIGVLPDICVCYLDGGCVDGYTLGLYDDKVIVGREGIITITHELGHTFGLCDEGYGSGSCSPLQPACQSGLCSAGGGTQCSGETYCCPNSPEQDSIMCTNDICDRGCSYAESFAFTSYNHLKNELLSYCN